MNVWEQPNVCEICGNSRGGEVQIRLIRWPDRQPGMSYEHIPRCLDNRACRSRIEAAGGRWPEEPR